MPTLRTRLRARLMAVADPARAPAMQAYMKSAMPFLGVAADPLRQTCKVAFAGLTYASADDWRGDVLALWGGAKFREERYAAIELSGVRAARPFQRFDALAMYEAMIVSGAWWDYVDPIATQRLWAVLCADPGPMKRAMRQWSHDDNLWKRRSAILCQLKAKHSTDVRLLFSCIEPSLGNKEFFLRKAIGWALRQYARTDPAEVRRYVRGHATVLSNLSRREALKRL
jgi:3-methyladenine DNA glycosylase AlkD